MNFVYNPTKKLLEKSNNAKINFLRKNITETPPLINIWKIFHCFGKIIYWITHELVYKSKPKYKYKSLIR